MSAPRWTVALLNWLALPGEADDVLGDLEEAHRARLTRHVAISAALRTSLDALDMAQCLLRERLRRRVRGQGRAGANFVGRIVSWLDVKLATRMLRKHPGLTAVAVFALAIAIPVGLLPLHILNSLTTPLPVEDGAEIVLVRNYDRANSEPVVRSLHDFVQWREELSSIEHLAMWRTDLFDVNNRDGQAAPVRGVEVTASVFAQLRVPPLIGRPLNAADEVKGAPAVVVISYDVWQSRLAGNPDVVGSTVRISAVPHTVVGVMPKGFLFPYRDQLWLPFRYDALDYARGAGPAVRIAGRLVKGVAIEAARSEIELLGERAARDFPETHTHLRPQVLPYTSALKKLTAPDAQWVILITQILALLLLVLACGNVGILILARVATRSSEIAIRTALGASRIRILSQLFIESLVLAVLAAGAGLLLLQAVATSPGFLLGELPYWVDFEVSLKTTLLALSLAVLSAAIAGVVPALKATGKRVQATIQSGSGSGIRFGKGYSALIVGEVAVALLFLAIGSWLMPALLAKPAELGIPTDQYLYATLRISRVDPMAKVEASNNPEFVRRVAVAQEELARRLSEEPGLGPVAVADVFPGMSHRSGWIQIEGLPRGPGAPAPGYLVNVARVDLRYFEAMKMPILSGRNFNNADLGEDRSAVMVNTSFVERVLGGRNPIGRRIRYWEAGKEPGPWAFEIVGVVEGLGMNALNPAADQGVYHVVAPGELHPLTIALRVGSDPARFTARLRSVVNEIDASALIQRVEPLNEVPHPERSILVMGTYLVALLAGIAVVLATACLYALMSFTVAKRTRECAIRTALGARPIGIMATIARKVFFQLSAGVMIGALLSAGFLSNLNSHGGMLPGTPSWPLNVALITLLVIAIAVLACVKPTLRAIRIRPVDALKG